MSSEKPVATPSALQQEAPLQPKRRSSSLALSLLMTGLGGFIGGMLTSYGPTYLNVHITQPVLAEPAPAIASAPEPGLRVAAFEASTMAPAMEPAMSSAPKGPDLRLVMHSPTQTYLVVQADAPKSWGQGAIKTDIDTEGFTFALRQKVVIDQIDSSLRAFQDRDYNLHDGRGFVCSASAGKLELVQQGVGDYFDASAPQEAWDNYGMKTLLVVPLHAKRGNCKSALWARDASLLPVSLALLGDANKKLRRQALAAFRDSKAYQSVQSEFAAQGGVGRWDRADSGEPNIRSIKSAEEELVFVGSFVGGCGEFEGRLGMVFRRGDDGELVAIGEAGTSLYTIEAAADVDGDGDLDLIGSGESYQRAFLRQGASGLIEESSFSFGIFYCGC